MSCDALVRWDPLVRPGVDADFIDGIVTVAGAAAAAAAAAAADYGPQEPVTLAAKQARPSPSHSFCVGSIVHCLRFSVFCSIFIVYCLCILYYGLR